jgi:hypothetical protein
MSTSNEEARIESLIDDIALDLIGNPEFSRRQIEADSKKYRALCASLKTAYQRGLSDATERAAKIAKEHWRSENGSLLHASIIGDHIAASIRSKEGE